jgi:sarcosine oxidase
MIVPMTAGSVPLQDLCVPGRATVAWFQTQQPELYSMDRFPVFILGDGQTHYYGFPEFGDKPGAMQSAVAS